MQLDTEYNSSVHVQLGRNMWSRQPLKLIMTNTEPNKKLNYVTITGLAVGWLLKGDTMDAHTSKRIISIPTTNIKNSATHVIVINKLLKCGIDVSVTQETQIHQNPDTAATYLERCCHDDPSGSSSSIVASSFSLRQPWTCSNFQCIQKSYSWVSQLEGPALDPKSAAYSTKGKTGS